MFQLVLLPQRAHSQGKDAYQAFASPSNSLADTSSHTSNSTFYISFPKSSCGICDSTVQAPRGVAQSLLHILGRALARLAHVICDMLDRLARLSG